MPLRIKTGPRDVYESGTILAGFEETIVLEIEDLRFSFEFQMDGEKPELGIASEVRGEKHLAIILKNFNNPLGSGIKEALKVGTLGRRKLYLNFWTATHGKENTREFVYTFSLGEVVDG